MLIQGCGCVFRNRESPAAAYVPHSSLLIKVSPSVGAEGGGAGPALLSTRSKSILWMRFLGAKCMGKHSELKSFCIGNPLGSRPGLGAAAWRDAPVSRLPNTSSPWGVRGWEFSFRCDA